MLLLPKTPELISISFVLLLLANLWTNLPSVIASHLVTAKALSYSRLRWNPCKSLFADGVQPASAINHPHPSLRSPSWADGENQPTKP